MRRQRLLCAIVLALSVTACQKPAPSRSRDDCDEKKPKDCEDCAKGDAKDKRKDKDKDKGDLCAGLNEQTELTPALRAMLGDISVYSAVPGAPVSNPTELYATLSREGATATEPIVTTGVSLVVGKQQIRAASLFNAPESATVRDGLSKYIKAGKLPAPKARGEIAIGHVLAAELGLAIGDKVTLLGPPGLMMQLPPATVEATVVGLLDFPFSPMLEYDNTLVLAPLADAHALALLVDTETQGYRVWLPDGDKGQRVIKLASAPLFATRMYQANTLEQVEAGVVGLRSGVSALCSR